MKIGCPSPRCFHIFPRIVRPWRWARTRNIAFWDHPHGRDGRATAATPSDGAWRPTGQEQYRVRIIPYRTLDNVIEGVVLTFTDITELKKVEADAQAARDHAQSIVDTVREPLVVLNGDRTVISARRSFYRLFGVAQKETVGRHLYELGNRQWDIPRLRGLLETVLPRETSFEDVAVEDEFPVIARRKMLLNARRVPGKAGQMQLIILAMQDVTGGPPAQDVGGLGKEKG